MPLLDAEAKKYGFELTNVGVAMPGSDQEAAWLEIRKINPDWVILREWGVAPAVALKTAQKVGFPANRIVAVTWAGTEDDLIPAGDAAKGVFVVHPFPTGADFPVTQEIKKYVYGGGNRGNLEDASRMGLVFYNVGVTYGIINTEAVRVAQEKFGKRPLTGEEVRWGLEHLDLNEARLKALGAWGLVQTIKSSCLDHEGGGAAKVYQWDGAKLVQVSDWIKADSSLTRPLIEEFSGQVRRRKGHYAARLLEGKLTAERCAVEGEERLARSSRIAEPRGAAPSAASQRRWLRRGGILGTEGSWRSSTSKPT